MGKGKNGISIGQYRSKASRYKIVTELCGKGKVQATQEHDMHVVPTGKRLADCERELYHVIYDRLEVMEHLLPFSIDKIVIIHMDYSSNETTRAGAADFISEALRDFLRPSNSSVND